MFFAAAEWFRHCDRGPVFWEVTTVIRSSRGLLGPCAVLAATFGAGVVLLNAEELDPPWSSGIAWSEPKVVDPGPPGGPPSDAIVLFDGKDMSQWHGGEPWTIRDGYAICRSEVMS